MKGMLFYPLLEPCADARGISPGHLRRWWLHQPDVAGLRPDRRWLPLPRLSWLAPRRVEGNEQSQLWDLDCLARRLADRKTPLMLAELNLSPQGIWELLRGRNGRPESPPPALLFSGCDLSVFCHRSAAPCSTTNPGADPLGDRSVAGRIPSGASP